MERKRERERESIESAAASYCKLLSSLGICSDTSRILSLLGLFLSLSLLPAATFNFIIIIIIKSPPFIILLSISFYYTIYSLRPCSTSSGKTTSSSSSSPSPLSLSLSLFLVGGFLTSDKAASSKRGISFIKFIKCINIYI